MNELKPAAELAAAASQPYPNDSAEYRRARTALLAEEIELRRHIERVAAQRRALPPGGEPPTTTSRTRTARRWGSPTCSAGTTRLSPTSGCTARSASGRARCARRSSARSTPRRGHLAAGRVRRDRPLAGRAPARLCARARLEHLNFYATVGDDFARDYRGLAPDGSEWPALDVWVKRDGKVLHFWGAELGGTADPGQDPRGAPDPTPLWNILDLTPAGRGTTGIRSSTTRAPAEVAGAESPTTQPGAAR